MKTICSPRVVIDRVPGNCSRFNVQLWYSFDGGKTFVYSGYGKFFDDVHESAAFIREHRSPIPEFPIITQKRQSAYEAIAENDEGIPMICGYRGRACRVMDSPEGANRALCYNCNLAEYCHNVEMMEYATQEEN